MLPVTCQYEITEDCSHRCPGCYNEFRYNRKKGAEKAEEISRRIAESEIFHAIITGGEPFEVREKLYSVSKIFEKANMDSSINTNLTLTTEEDMRALADRGLISVLTSMFSYKKNLHERLTRKRGSFDNLLRGIDASKKVGLGIAVNMVVSQLNFSDVYETGNFLFRRFGDLTFCATPQIPTPGSSANENILTRKQYIQTLDELLKLNQEIGIKVDSVSPPIPCMFEDPNKYGLFLKRACTGGIGTFTVSENGDIRPCSHSNGVYGNILSEELDNILARMISWREKLIAPAECSSCAYEKECAGGCRIAALATCGKINGKPLYFTGPIKARNIKSLEIEAILDDKRICFSDGRFRYREEKDGRITVYLNPTAIANLPKEEFNLLNVLRSYNGRDFSSLKQELGIEENFLKNTIIGLSKSNLLILKNWK